MPNHGSRWSIGSTWIRIDPHIHAPGTVLNNQFADDWAGYVRRINEAVPAPTILGITDYFGLSVYDQVRARWLAGELPSVKVVFPNIEIRLHLKVEKGSGVNLHLLVDPSEPDHSLTVREKLKTLSFVYDDESYRCSDHDLKRLGRAFAKNSALPDDAALRKGVEQFKVNPEDLFGVLANDAWFKRNVLIAVPAGADGLGGIGRKDAFDAMRQRLAKGAHIIFSGNVEEREFWVGRKDSFSALNIDPKPCLHGSDAHELDRVLRPDKDRHCWIRCEATFEGLRQTILEPERRVYIGNAAPPQPVPAQIIRSMTVMNAAAWFPTEPMSFNEGLVTVIGARGSGKTALADLAAFAAGALSEKPGPASFVAKAQADKLLNGVTVELVWGDGSKTSSTFGPRATPAAVPRVRYLSQQFVEELCSKEGLVGPLVEEIERVVFHAIAEEDRQGADNFAELRELVVEPVRTSRTAAEAEVAELTRAIAKEVAMQGGLGKLRLDAGETFRQREAAKTELVKLPAGNDAAKKEALEAADLALKALKAEIVRLDRRTTDITTLRAELEEFYRAAKQKGQAWRARFGALLVDAEWDSLLPTGAVPLEWLRVLREEAAKQAAEARAAGLPDCNPALGVKALGDQCDRLTRELGLDASTVAKRSELNKKITELTTAHERQGVQIALAEKCSERIAVAKAARLVAYERIFDTVLEETCALDRLYGPLQDRAKQRTGAKIQFMVKRLVDVEEWARRGEKLLDLRKRPFAAQNGLRDLAEFILGEAWRTGTPGEVRAAMEIFLSHPDAPTPAHRLHEVQPEELGHWLFSTGHIRVVYSILYEGVELHRLSPGTRGVVLLTLYLGLDEWDERPLLIDQPEENLDPQSVYTDLVSFFRAAGARRVGIPPCAPNRVSTGPSALAKK